MGVMMVLTSERVGKRPGATPTAFPPLIFTGIASISVFRVSPPPVDCDHRGGLYIGIFRSGWASGHKDGWHRRSQAQTSLGGAARPGSRATWSRPLCLVSLTSWSPGVSHDKILTLQKFQVNLSSGRFLELKNTQNRVFLSCRVITKTKGIDGKSP
jgi:hypothetical protein